MSNGVRPWVPALALFWCLVVGVPSSAQEPAELTPQEETRLLRDAAGRESRGDFQGAEALLRGLLDRSPTSSGALFALERVLRAQGRVASVLPVVDRYLSVEPDAPAPRYLKLRVLTEVDSLVALEDEARDWIQADRRSTDPYKEIARVYERAFGPERALEILREGREALGVDWALSVEMGDLLVRSGRHTEAVTEWARSIRSDGAQLSTVLRRIGQLEGDRAEIVRPMVRLLARTPTTIVRRRAATQIAVEAGLEEEALDLAQGVARELAAAARVGFLAEVARRAEESGVPRVALWAYGEMRGVAARGADARSLDQQIAASALSLGDTTQALEAQERVALSLPEGSPERRRALAATIRMAASVRAPREVKEGLDSFRSEYPDASELDELASTVAVRFLGREGPESTATILEGIDGPRSSLERAYLRLAQGEVPAAAEDLMKAVEGLPPSRATEVIQLVNVLGRVSETTARVVAEVAVLRHRGDANDAVTLLETELPGVPKGDLPPLLAMASRLAAETGQEQRSSTFRLELIQAYPDAPEAPEAALAEARYLGRLGEIPAALRMLEELILGRPDSPIVPDARRELQQLQRLAPGGDCE